MQDISKSPTSARVRLAQQVKVLCTKPDTLSSIPNTHVVERSNTPTHCPLTARAPSYPDKINK